MESLRVIVCQQDDEFTVTSTDLSNDELLSNWFKKTCEFLGVNNLIEALASVNPLS